MIVSTILRNYSKDQFIKSPKLLYKHLLRLCEKLPKDAEKFYKHSIYQSFIQHKTETDKETIEKMVNKTLEDADWILKKYTAKKKT